MIPTLLPRCLLLACALTLAHGCSSETPDQAAKGKAETRAVPVILAAVEQREFTQPIEGIGTARARESVLVTSRVNGRVDEIYFTEGAGIEKDQPLAHLEDDEERAELEAARATAKQTESRLKRMQALTARGLVSQDQTEEQAQLVKGAEARLELARVKLEQRTIRAPFSGQLGFKQVSPGSLVQPGTAIVSLDAMDTLRVEFAVPETQLADLAVGAPVEVRAAAYPTRAFEARISTIGSRVDETTRAVQVHAEVANTDGALKPGMLLTVSVAARPRAAHFVPEAAVAPENSQHYVWRVRADGTVEKVRVLLGTRIPDWVEVLQGLSPGDRVVVEGHANLRPGIAVREAVAAAAVQGS